MKKKQLSKLIKNPQQISSTDISYLDTIILENPYFQTGHILIARGLLNINSIRYNKQLKKAAAYSIDRTKLFELITIKNNKHYKNKTNDQQKETTTKLEIGNPLDFQKNEMHSFSEWLNILNAKKIKRKKPELIDEFLKKDVKLSKPKKEVFFKAINIAKESLINNEELVTPTLAKVYLEQGHYEKAISAYNKLILKYPKKSSLFASQIKLIKELNKK
tara:strand:- start:468 stop:1121 length:654 start_codon:yes stop_codon:yes gene_type:complete